MSSEWSEDCGETRDFTLENILTLRSDFYSKPEKIEGGVQNKWV